MAVDSARPLAGDDADIAAEAGIAPDVYARRWIILAVLCLSLLIIGLDNTILNVALPSLVRDLDATSSQLQWIVDAYTIVFASLLLTSGSLGDRFGRRGALSLGLVIFGVGSIASAFAGSANILIATRAVQGVGGAFIMPSTLSILTNVFPASERGRAIGVWAGVSGLGVAIGPLVGGWLLRHFWWGSVFLINVPVVVVALIAGWFIVPTSRDPSAPKLDPVGTVLSITGLTAVLYGIIEAPTRGWSDSVILVAFAIGAVTLVSFALWEIHSSHPMLDVKFFKNPRFTAASLAVTLVFFAMFGSLFFLTQYLQFVLGYDAFQSGLRLTPVAAGLMVAAPLSARFVEWFGTKIVVTAGLSIVACGLLLLSRATANGGYGLLLIVLLVLAFGMGTAMAPATDSIMGSLPRERAGVGSAVNDTTRQIGGALGVAVLGSIHASVYRNQLSHVPQLSRLPAQAQSAVRDSVGGALAVAAKLPAPFDKALTALADNAFVHAMDRTVLVGALIAFAGALIALVFLPARPNTEVRVAGNIDRLAVSAAHGMPVNGQESVVVNATLHTLAEAGFSSLNFNAIAARSGVDTAAIERRWNTRVELVNEAVRSLVAEALPSPATGSARDDARIYLEGVIALMQAPEFRPAIASLVAAANRDEELGDALRASLRQHREAHLTRIVERGVAHGELPAALDVPLAVSLLVGPVWHRVLVTGEEIEPSLAGRLVDAVFPTQG